ncbi:hypothetical protein ACP4OV_025544 [Aristida adscensionis]
MMVGRRGSKNDPMRRTTSMTEFAPPDELEAVVEDEEAVVGKLPESGPGVGGGQDWLAAFGGDGDGDGGAAGRGRQQQQQEDWLAAYRARAAPARARAGLRRNSADCAATEAAAFLRACGLCRRRLGPGRDTFMYKGEAAFCSLECRQQHMTQEEWKDKCAVRPVTTSSVKDAPAPVTGRRGSSGKPSGAGAGAGAGGGTVAAA